MMLGLMEPWRRAHLLMRWLWGRQLRGGCVRSTLARGRLGGLHLLAPLVVLGPS